MKVIRSLRLSSQLVGRPKRSPFIRCCCRTPDFHFEEYPVVCYRDIFPGRMKLYRPESIRVLMNRSKRRRRRKSDQIKASFL